MTNTDAETQPTSPADPHQDRTDRHARQLARMAELGMRLAENLCLQAESNPPEDPQAVALAFARITRAVRLCQLLENRFAEAAELRALDPERARRLAEAERARERERQAQNKSRADKRREVLKDVLPEMIASRAENDLLIDREDLTERAEDLIDYEIEDHEIEARPIVELIGLIARDLKIDPDWSLWDPRRFEDADRWALSPEELDPANAPGCKKSPTAHWPPPGTVDLAPAVKAKPKLTPAPP